MVSINPHRGGAKANMTVRLNIQSGVLAVDRLVDPRDDQPRFCLFLCRDKNNIEVGFDLSKGSKPNGLSKYMLFENLP